MNSNCKKQNKDILNIKYFFYDFAEITHFLLIWLWLRPKKIYINENAKKAHIKGGFLLSSNHTGYTDPIVLCSIFPLRRIFYVTTKECFDTPIKNLFFTACLCIKIDRDDVGTKAFKRIVETLKNEHIVGIFPEGHVNISLNKLDSFHSGQILMAHMANVPILPVYRIRAKNFLHREKVVIGEPINVRKEIGDKPTMKQIDELSKKLFDYEFELAKFYKGEK